MGFWANKNGQKLLGSYSAALGSWLASTYPNLFGNLSGATGTQVGTYFINLKAQSGLSYSTETDALALALNVYVTTTGLGWTTTAASYGFKQGFGGAGLGAILYNVGNNGASFGVANNN